MSALEEVAAALDPTLASHLVPDPGPQRFDAATLGSDLAFVLEAVWEGYLVHYRVPRAFTGMDPDLRLLAGDALYALGLDRLAQRGEVAAVAELGELISGTARAEAEGARERVGELWERSVARLSGGAR
ncbi:MAG: hypothetical protein H0T15_06120 [Thermoleophilaceae bacterium]|nr:hypothetical protein [Thermoleophilaceae bacterium]